MKEQPRDEYWNGSANKLIRYYFYMQRGLILLNEFRYLIMAIFALYYTLRLDNPLLIPLMFILSVPVLISFGYLSVHKMAKVMEYLNIQFATHWSRYGYQLQEERNQLLKDIKESI